MTRVHPHRVHYLRNAVASDDASPLSHRPLDAVSSGLLRPWPVVPAFISRGPVAARAVEDRRLFHPDRMLAPVRSSRRWFVRTQLLRSPKAPTTRWGLSVSTPPGAKRLSWSRLQFRSPRFVQICVRRHARREVLHAFRRVGRGVRTSRRRRRSQWSNFAC